uniref:Uncharacterized protein n=1 Tax=Desulfobacca acetoxidans TaxID=60893 RepID=A0A7V6A2Q0_9BACT
MGCADAVRAALLRLAGVLGATYHPGQDLFTVRFESVLVNLETMFATVIGTGKRWGRSTCPPLPPRLQGLDPGRHCIKHTIAEGLALRNRETAAL